MKQRELIRIYQPSDLDAVLKIFRAQNLPVYLPIPHNPSTGEGDPSVVVALVGEEEGEIKRALIARAGLEVHYVVSPGDASPAELNRMAQVAEGVAMQMGVELARLRFPVFTDVRARVPKAMPSMISYMQKHLDFVPETDAFVGFCKRIGT